MYTTTEGFGVCRRSVVDACHTRPRTLSPTEKTSPEKSCGLRDKEHQKTAMRQYRSIVGGVGGYVDGYVVTNRYQLIRAHCVPLSLFVVFQPDGETKKSHAFAEMESKGFDLNGGVALS
jgi:hypothetical protein